MRIPIVLDRASAIPLQRQLYDGWRQGILEGRFRPGDRLPSSRELARTLGVARATVTAAYEQLVAEGYLDSSPGAGTFICRELPDQHVSGPASRRAATPPVRLSAYAGRLAPRPVRTPVPAGIVNLSKAGPDLDHFPFPLWRRLLMRHLRHVAGPLFTQVEQSAGYEPLRRELAGYLARSRAVRCQPDQLVIVNGSQQALDLSMRLLIDAGDAVALEDPGYPGARHLAAAHGAGIQAVGIDPEGLRVSELADDVRLVYVTPSHQFPTGISMSLSRRLELLEWARSRGAVIVEDDYDSEYRYSGPPLPALQGLTGEVPVIYIGTFSNVMFTALRIGYVVVPRELIAAFSDAKWATDRYTPLLEQAALADFIREGHLERHIRRMRRLYRRRRDVLIDALRRHFGDQAVVRGDAAGMHTLVRFAARDIAARADRNRVRLPSADHYYLSGRSPNEFIISFSATGERALAEAVKRVARCD